MARRNPLYDVLKRHRWAYDPRELSDLFRNVSERRVNTLAEGIAAYISSNLPNAFERRRGLRDYRTNPYVLMTAASVMSLDDAGRFAQFLFNSKLYMALETSFGKSIESTLVGPYPVCSSSKWTDAPEAIKELEALEGLSNQEKARKRSQSAWREIDKSVVVDDTRYMTTIKSGPNTINDSQVQAMTQAIAINNVQWLSDTDANYPGIERLDIVLGLTYGTPLSTNNKDNQILVKLLDYGFEEEDRDRHPGVLVDSKTGRIRVYRRIGRDFWAFVGNPADPDTTRHVFLEILLGLAKALSTGIEQGDLESRINQKIDDLAYAVANIRLPRGELPGWIREDFDGDELFWFATALAAFYDSGN